MDSFQDNINYENRIVLEDRDKLISLLEEYSIKLRKKCNSIGRNLRIFNLTLIFCSVLGGIIFAASLTFTTTNNNNTKFILNPLIFFIVLTLMGIILLFSTSIKNKIINFSRTYEAHSLAHRLEKLVRIASEFYEHVEKKEISKIELDLKIAEAESVLNYYDSIVGKPKKYSDKK